VEYVPFNVSLHIHPNFVFGENCGYSMHKCRGVNHYDHECHRSTYRQKLLSYVENKVLPMNQVATAGPSANKGDAKALRRHKKWVAETCGKLREKDYMDQPFFFDGNSPIERNRESEYDKE
jgi:hypothetical protein